MVAIRQQELQLKDKEIDIDQQNFAAKQQSSQQETMIDAELAQQRLDVSKTIADDKLQLGLDRMKQQANLKLLELEQKYRRQ